MSKTKRFEIYSDEPSGPTFDEDGKGSSIYDRLAGPKNKKRSDRFGIENDEPCGETFEDPPKSHINFPKADSGPHLGVKVLAATSGQGEYEPRTDQLPDANVKDTGGGSIPIGKSSPKHGKMKLSQRFKP